ncbi:MAG: chorismate mutase [Candidatus Caccosoma sp.]|nr:chorismate mutase [Candidatus Caccosoma sp.]
MDELDILREKVNAVDKELAKLFEERMKLIKDIAKRKKEINYPVYDQGRETFLLIRNGSYIEDKEIRVLYFELLNKIFELSKKMQENIIHSK